MKILVTAAPSYGLMLPIVPLVWAARAAGHEVALATTSEMTQVAANAGLTVIDVFPDRERWAALTGWGKSVEDLPDDAPLEVRNAVGVPAPFAMFTATMTEGTIAAARAFRPDAIATTGDHPAGLLAATAVGVPALEVGNRVSWSTRDASWRNRPQPMVPANVLDPLRERLGPSTGSGQLSADGPNLIARIDPRAPSMGGIAADLSEVPDEIDGRPWWGMQYVPYNGGAVVPDWVHQPAIRPRIGVTLGTVVPLISGTSSLGVVIEALSSLDVDVVLAAGTADLTSLGPLPANVRSVGYLPLSAFLPGLDLLVHHGGSGTTAAPLFYGVPQLVLPAFADNPMSAQRVTDRGVGLSHDPKTITATIIQGLIDRLLTEPEFAETARQVQAEIATQPTPSAIMARVEDAVKTR
jgi:UDP:flavonoid glycosyltransferase YjiC (YdhE family)